MIKLNHVEIPVLDLTEAKTFFKEVFDWKIDTESMPNYGLLEIENWPSFGFFVVKKIPTPGVNIVLEVDDIPAVLSKIEKAGGKIIREKYLIAENVGYAADFEDIFGNKMSLFSDQ